MSLIWPATGRSTGNARYDRHCGRYFTQNEHLMYAAATLIRAPNIFYYFIIEIL